MNKLIPRGIQTLLSCIKSSTLFRQLILHKIESNYLLVGRNIFTKINIREHSVFFLGICKKNFLVEPGTQSGLDRLEIGAGVARWTSRSTAALLVLPPRSWQHHAKDPDHISKSDR